MDAAEFASFVAKQRAALDAARERARADASEALRSEIRAALAGAYDRVPDFSSWYFAYPTTYQLLGIAASSAARHAVSFRTEQSLSEAVAEDVQIHVRRKYEAIVLRPALTDPLVHRAFVRALRSVREGCLSAIDELESSVAAFASERATATLSSPPRPDDVIVDVDWAAQLQKVEHVPTVYEKSPAATVALIGAGAAAGKVAGSAAATGAAAKAVAAKIAAPFATKAAGATLGKAAAAGATAGAIAGPVGAAAGVAAGAAIGLGVDVTVNAGVTLMQRPALERDVRDSLDATVLEWEERLLPELERVQGIWFDQAAALIVASDDVESKQNRKL